jgi:hypothetical protein
MMSERNQSSQFNHDANRPNANTGVIVLSVQIDTLRPESNSWQGFPAIQQP